jgi:hypothetical protein
MRVRINRCSAVPHGGLLDELSRQQDVLTFTFNPDDITALGARELGTALTTQVTSWTERAACPRGTWYPCDVLIRRASGMPHGALLWVHEEVGCVQYWFDRTLITRKGAVAFARTMTRLNMGWVQAGNAPALHAVAG